MSEHFSIFSGRGITLPFPGARRGSLENFRGAENISRTVASFLVSNKDTHGMKQLTEENR